MPNTNSLYPYINPTGNSSLAYRPDLGGWGSWDPSKPGQWNTVVPEQSTSAIGGSDLASDALARTTGQQGSDAFALYSGLASAAARQQRAYAEQSQFDARNAFAVGQGETNNLRGVETAGWDALAAAKDRPQVDSRLGDSYAALMGYANQAEGPSAAQAQLQAATGRNIADQFAMANSGRNAGQQAQAARQAAFAAADLNANAARDASMLRAQEAATWRNQQLAALGQASGVAGNIESANQAIDQARAAQTQSAIAQLAAIQGQRYGQVMGNYGALAAGNQAAASIASGGTASQLAALQSGSGLKESYDRNVLEMYAGNANRASAAEQARLSDERRINAEEELAWMQRDERDKDRWFGAAGSLIGAGFGLL